VKKFLRDGFSVAVLISLVFAGWALWTAGLFDTAVARDVRTSSVYAAEGTGLDEEAAERIIGNRRLVVILEQSGVDLAEVCDDVERAADGTIVVILSREDDDFDHYGCALLPGRSDENFGRALVAESTVFRGIDNFYDRPIDAVKVAAVNYDLLVRAGTVPDGPREFSAPLPRYLIAFAAIAAVVLGAVAVTIAARRASRLAIRRQEQRAETDDARSKLTAASAGLAQQIIDLDRGHSEDKRYRKIIDDYVRLLDDIAEASTEEEYSELTKRVDALSARCLKV